ncbi:hypothetical protein D9M70_535020 [compost metagenome]
MAPTIGNSVTLAERRISTGVNAISVMTLSIRLTPRPSTVVEKRIVSSCTRCDAPSMWRSLSHFDM